MDASSFAVGDRVVVVEGGLKHVVGFVTRIDEDQVLIKPEHKDLEDLDSVPVPPRQLRKFFKISDHVKVNNGRHQGETGLVIQVEDKVVHILSDLGMKEIKVGEGGGDRLRGMEERVNGWYVSFVKVCVR